MCDYSLENVTSRPAATGQRLVTTDFISMTRGLSEIGDPDVAICRHPGTEIAFDREVKAEPNYPFLPKYRIGERTTLSAKSRSTSRGRIMTRSNLPMARWCCLTVCAKARSQPCYSFREA